MLLGFLVMVAYIPGLTGGTIPAGWVLLWLVMPFVLFGYQASMTAVHWLGAAFLFYAGLSLAWSPSGLFGMMQLAALGAVFIWASCLEDIRPVLKGLATGLSVSALIALYQYYGWQIVPNVGIAGLFFNPNLLAEASALLAILLVSYRMWPWLIATAPGLVGFSRASLVALVAVGVMWLWSRSRWAAFNLMAACGVVIGFITMMWSERLISVQQRFDLWRDTVGGLTWFGRGVGSYVYTFPEITERWNVTKARPDHVHNDLLEFAYEFGVGVLPLLIGLTILVVRGDYAERYALVGVIAIAMFGFPFHSPVTGFIAALVAGQLSRHIGVVRTNGFGSRPVLSARVPTW